MSYILPPKTTDDLPKERPLEVRRQRERSEDERELEMFTQKALTVLFTVLLGLFIVGFLFVKACERSSETYVKTQLEFADSLSNRLIKDMNKIWK